MKEIEKVADEIEKGTYSEMTTSAVRIASKALETYTGELLDKALMVSKAIVEFEDALMHPK